MESAVRDALEGTVLVAHNASFDISFISAEMRSAGIEPPSNPVVDTLGLARRCYTFRSNKLGDVARTLGIRVNGLHRALADATITWHVLTRFLLELQQNGVNTLDDVIRMQGALTPLSGYNTAPPTMEWTAGNLSAQSRGCLHCSKRPYALRQRYAYATRVTTASIACEWSSPAKSRCASRPPT